MAKTGLRENRLSGGAREKVRRILAAVAKGPKPHKPFHSGAAIFRHFAHITAKPGKGGVS